VARRYTFQDETNVVQPSAITGGIMATTVHPAKKVYPAHGDPIRIVPLHVPDGVIQPTADAAAAPAAAPQLTYRNGPLLTAVEVFTIFWGPLWQQAAQSAMATQLNQFFDFILTSSLLDQLSEYNVPGQQIGHGRRTGSITITTPALKQSVSDTAIQHMLQQEISTNPAFPHPTPNTLYFVYIEPGVKVVQGGSASCQAFCGYHNDISGQIFYAAMPYPGCGGCTGGLTPLDALTSTSSHEMCEAITDAIPGQGWYDDANGEIGDICAWKTKKLGAYTVQLEWSNKANKCV
jgi:hypothetical protein